jgi:hypothetical protein
MGICVPLEHSNQLDERFPSKSFSADLSASSPSQRLSRYRYGSLPWQKRTLPCLKLALTSLPSFDNFHRHENFKKGVMMVSNILGIIIGVVFIIIGLVLLCTWWSSFVVMFKGIFPILLILIGAGALIYFISEIKSKLEISKEEKTIPEQK